MSVLAVSAPVPSGLTPSVATPACDRPIIGIMAVILGAFISSLNTRLTTFGLADVRGALGFGFDEATWISTVFGAAQMAVTPAAAWMATVLSTRRVLLWTGSLFAIASIFPPLVHDYALTIALQLVRGLAVGAFIPAALGFVLRSLHPRWWMWGIAAYAFRFTFSQNISGSIEGWYSESGFWEGLYWQNVPLTALMLVLVSIAMPRRAVDRVLLARTDWGAIVYAGAGFALIYAGLDQGNRLDWFNSGLVNGLLLGGLFLVAIFFVHEALTPTPLIHLPVLAGRNVWGPALLISLYGFGSTATGFVLPDYLTRVQGLRDIQIGDSLNWIALPQIVLVPLVAVLVRRIDARYLLVIGFATIAIGSWMCTQLTHDWAGGDFLPSQCVEAVGLAFAITALVTYAISFITPAQAAAIATTIQIARLMGAELGSALIQTFVRVREQTHSNELGTHIVGGAASTTDTQTLLSGVFANRATGLGDAASQGTSLLAAAVQREAYVLAYIDAFWLIAWASLAGLLVIVLLRRPPPNPLTPPRLPV